MTCDPDASTNVTTGPAAQIRAGHLVWRGSRQLALLPALLLVALFGSEQASVGESLPEGVLTTLGEAFVSPDDTGSRIGYEWNVVGSHLPTAANSSNPRILPGKVPVNDTDSGVGLYPRETVERNGIVALQRRCVTQRRVGSETHHEVCVSFYISRIRLHPMLQSVCPFSQYTNVSVFSVGMVDKTIMLFAPLQFSPFMCGDGSIASLLTL